MRCGESIATGSFIDALMASETTSRMDQTAVAQPTNFALQVALAEVWRAWGITPSVIVGHSAGEVAAAHVAGMLSLEDAVKVIFHRSRLQQLTAGEGSMAAVGLSLENAQAALKGYEDRVSIAAINSPSSVTLSGDAEAIAEIVRGLSARQVFARMLAVEVPYHSSKMDRLQTELLEALADVHPKPYTIPIFSTFSGSLADETAFDAAYWWKNVREPVCFARAVQALIRDGAKVFLEIAPHPVLSRSILE